MSSYYFKKGKKFDFRFFENRYFEDSQENYANDFFLFKVRENDLSSLGFIYWAHIAIWQLGFSNEITRKNYPINNFKAEIISKFEELGINVDPPNFGYYNPNNNVSAFSWDFPKFTVINIFEKGILVSDDEMEQFYFDFNECDICSKEDLQYDDTSLNIDTVVTCNPGDPVFISDDDFENIRQDLLSKIKTLNNIYSTINFPYLIELVSV